MAENKNSFVLYKDQRDVFDALSDEDAGKLIKHIFSYISDENPEAPSEMLGMLFIQIRSALKRDLKKWEDKKIKKSEAGKKGMATRWAKQNITDDNGVINDITDVTKITVNVNDNVNVNASTIGRGKVWEFLRGAAPISVSETEIDAETDKLMKEYQGRKIGNLRALCNKWMANYLEHQTMPVIQYKPKMVI